MKISNFSMSSAGHYLDVHSRDYSLRFSEASEIAHTSFDARANTAAVLYGIAAGVRPNDTLMFAAAAAIQRQARITESPEQWADRLSETFFDGLDRRD